MSFQSYIRESTRILILDGAVGTVLQKRNFTEHDFRGKTFADHDSPLKGRYELLCLTQPEAVTTVHEKYLAAGADIISTNTFGASPLELADCNLQDRSAEVYRTAAWLARAAANKYREIDSGKPRFVAGVIGPTRFISGKLPGAGDFATADFDELVQSYRIAVETLIKGQVDCLLVESVYILENARAALTAIAELKEVLKSDIPVWVSFTLANHSTKMLSGESIVDAARLLGSFRPDVIGLNCGADPEHLSQFLSSAFEIGASVTAFHPSAGLPDSGGKYTHSAESFVAITDTIARRGWVDIVGGCCGTDPTFISALSKSMSGITPRRERLRSSRV